MYKLRKHGKWVLYIIFSDFRSDRKYMSWKTRSVKYYSYIFCNYNVLPFLLDYGYSEIDRKITNKIINVNSKTLYCYDVIFLSKSYYTILYLTQNFRRLMKKRYPWNWIKLEAHALIHQPHLQRPTNQGIKRFINIFMKVHLQTSILHYQNRRQKIQNRNSLK